MHSTEYNVSAQNILLINARGVSYEKEDKYNNIFGIDFIYKL